MNTELRQNLFNIAMTALILTALFGGILFFICGDIPNKSGTKSIEVVSENGGDLDLIGEFTTDYSLSCAERKHNIELAAAALDGTRAESGEEISFNRVVGARTEERGYKIAKVIFNGEYTDGVGGGVCQVSSTLYNAWVLSGLDVVSCRAHTIPSIYVGFSRDAAVSELIDLILLNNAPSETYITATADGYNLIVKIYGMPHGKTFRIKSELIETVKPDRAVFEEIVCDVSTVTYEVLREGKVGYKTRAFIEEIKDGAVINSRVLREDFYYPTPPKILKKIPKSQSSHK